MKPLLLLVWLNAVFAARLFAAPLSLDTQLLIATQKGQIKQAQVLVRKGAHINARNADGQTPLMLAAQNSNAELVAFLLRQGADVKSRDKDGFSSLGYGPEFAQLFIARGAKATRNDSAALSDWLENEIWIDSDIEDEQVKADVRLFMRAGVNLNTRGFDEFGTTPLLNAVASRPTLVPFLLGVGADPNLSGKGGNTPLIEAISPLSLNGKSDSLARFLLKSGAEVNTRGEYGETALMLAAQANSVALAEELLKRGANPNIRDRRGETALMRAARGGFPDMARLLLSSGADKKLTNPKGESALDYAKSREFVMQDFLSGRHLAATTEQLQERAQRELQRALRGRMEVQAILEGKKK